MTKRELKRHYKRLNNKKTILSKNKLRNRTCDNCYHSYNSFVGKLYCNNPKVKLREAPTERTCVFFITPEEYREYEFRKNRRRFDWYA